ncbi:MAG TPA: SRPBCC family protein [Acidimicrobiia bacterium]|nr:SRPBCC family protein [Acidimicrobiia bacterium]
MPSPFRFDRAWHFAVTPSELWTTLSHTDRYREWWPWLRTFEADGDDVLATGRTAHVVIQAPLPYQLHCTVRVDDAVRDERLVTTVDGDLQGPARLDLRPVEGGTEARLAWEFELRAPLLRTLAMLGRPAMAWAHDRIVERGLEQFEGHALRERDLQG